MSLPKETDPLVERTDFRGHLTPHCRVDPNRIIYEEYLRLYGEDMAEKFLAYRKSFEAVNRNRTVLPYPLTVNVGLRDACNLRCPHCYRQYDPFHAEVDHLSTDQAKRLIDQCAAMGTPAMLFGTASEYFTHPDAMEILRHACDKPEFLDIFLATNGQLLDEKRIEALLDMRLTRITVSIDAATPETYATVRGGDLHRLERLLHYLLDRRRERGQRLPVLRVTFLEYNLTRHERDRFSRRWSELADIVDIQKFMDVRIIDSLKDLHVERLDCAYPWNMLFVRWDGVVFPCCSEFYKHIPVGDFNTQSLAEIWNGHELAKLRRAMTTPGEYPLACENCILSLGATAPVPGLKP